MTVDFATADGTATQPSDYTANSGTVTFAPGETSKTVTVQVNGDTTVEPNETFNVNLSNATGNATIADAQGVGTIVNDDVAASNISINDVSHNEGNSGQTAYDFTVSLNAAQAAPVTVDFATADGTATQPGDYAANTGTVTFAPGETSKTVTVQVNGDTAVEPNETFFVNLSNATGNATIADNQGVGTIVNDDHTGDLDQRRRGDRGQQRADRCDVHGLAQPGLRPDGDGRFRDRRRHGDAPSDYTVEVGDGDLRPRRHRAAGDRAGQRRHHRGAERDVQREPLERHQRDDRRRPGRGDDRQRRRRRRSNISINDVSHNEGNSGQTAYDFTVSLDAPQAAPVTVDFATADGTATRRATTPRTRGR